MITASVEERPSAAIEHLATRRTGDASRCRQAHGRLLPPHARGPHRVAGARRGQNTAGLTCTTRVVHKYDNHRRSTMPFDPLFSAPLSARLPCGQRFSGSSRPPLRPTRPKQRGSSTKPKTFASATAASCGDARSADRSCWWTPRTGGCWPTRPTPAASWCATAGSLSRRVARGGDDRQYGDPMVRHVGGLCSSAPGPLTRPSATSCWRTSRSIASSRCSS